MRSKGSASAPEPTRRQAVGLVLDGHSQVAVARRGSLHPVTVAKWVARHRADGDDPRAAKPTPGRPRFPSPTHEQRVTTLRTRKPTAHGFRTELWRARRIARWIRRHVGVTFHPDSTRRWLTEPGDSPQRPLRADPGPGGRRWPPREGVGDRRHQCPADGSAVGVRLRVGVRWVRPRGKGGGVSARHGQTPSRQRRRGPGSRPEAHGGAIRRFLSRSRRRRSERLPAWAPDHNPEEAVWSWWTSGERANFAPSDGNTWTTTSWPFGSS